MLSIPAIDDLLVDRELRGAPTLVYLYLARHLDPVAFRPVKKWGIAEFLKIRKQTVGRAIRLLVAKGWIEEGPLHAERRSNGTIIGGDTSRVYRIAATRRVDDAVLAPPPRTGMASKRTLKNAA